LRSHGPFHVYNHAEKKGTANTIKKITEQANQRFQQEMNQIKSVKEFERTQHQMSMVKKDIVANHS
jgi:regulator of sigma D